MVDGESLLLGRSVAWNRDINDAGAGGLAKLVTWEVEVGGWGSLLLG